MEIEYPEKLSESLKRLSEKKRELEALSLHVTSCESLEHKLRIELTHGSTAIEGNTLTLRETQLLLDEGITPEGSKALRELHEVRNHNEAVIQIGSWVKDVEVISVALINEMHRVVMRDIDDVNSGRFRTSRVMVTGAPLQPVRPELISPLMTELFENKAESPLHPVVLATISHYRFVKIHPYFDGNGRTGRLLMNWILTAAGYPLTVISAGQRVRYITSIDEADLGRPHDFCALIIECVESSLDQFLDLV